MQNIKQRLFILSSSDNRTNSPVQGQIDENAWRIRTKDDNRSRRHRHHLQAYSCLASDGWF